MTPENERKLAAVAEAFCRAKGITFSGLAGHGEFKATYRVIAPNGDSVALKVYLPGAVTERARREIEALALLSATRHRSLPSFLAIETFIYGGQEFVLSAEEFLDGGSLSDFIRANGLLSRDQVVAMGRQLSSAIEVVERAQLVHRDVKPDNIVLRGDGTPVLVDFGLVRNLAQHSLTQTWLARGPGTPLFSAPEQLNNDKHLIDWRTDQFSLAVSLAFCGFGNHPYATAGDAVDSLIARVATRKGPSAEFIAWATANNLAPLARMVDAWPVGRYRIPQDLQAALANL